MDEVERLRRIDVRVDHMLKMPRYEGMSAVEVWDLAADEVDWVEKERVSLMETCRALREVGITYAAWGGL